ncbi:MAG: ABC transporter ATP-binding protein [Candidatus Protistobacter heckmanni]|nr:ABC transporter ATP-binding protein [Candidatus Protistobacter heckmanni]
MSLVSLANPRTDAPPLIATRGLSLGVGGKFLLRALDWQVGPGECWAVVGRNGAGKSTLLRALAGLGDTTGGGVELAGRPLHTVPLAERTRLCAYLPQGRADAFGYSALDTVLAARHQQQSGYWDAPEDIEAAMRCLRRLDVAELARRDVRSLSSGERQRVSIAALLAQDAPLLLLDEPAAALDLAHQIGLQRLTNALRNEGRGVVLVSHDLNLAAAAATHALLMLEVGCWLAGPAAEILEARRLGECLGHRVQAIEHAGRCIFVPVYDEPVLENKA